MAWPCSLVYVCSSPMAAPRWRAYCSHQTSISFMPYLLAMPIIHDAPDARALQLLSAAQAVAAWDRARDLRGAALAAATTTWAYYGCR